MSTAENPNGPEVIVVGAGPVGLVAGCELARRGVRVRVIDKLAQPTEQSRAIAVHARSLDMFERMGIVDEMLSTGIRAIAMQLYAGHSKLFRVPLGGVDSAFPFTLTTAQTETERVLGEHLESRGITVERGVELAALSQDAQEVHLTLRREDGSAERVSASWVIGADGAHSAVRHLVGSPAGGQGMNTGMQDAFNLAWKLAAVISGQAGDTLLDSYEAERIPVADSVITFTHRLTRAGTLSGVPRQIRDMLIRVVSHVPAARRAMANAAEEVNVNYKNSPLAVGRRPSRAKVAAGEHVPHVVDPAIQKQLSAVCGAQNTGHIVLTVAAGQVAPAAGGHGPTQLLVTAGDTPVAGYDTFIADPNSLVAQRFGLKNGGRIVIRPDGYIGAVASLDDTTTIADYFAKVRS